MKKLHVRIFALLLAVLLCGCTQQKQDVTEPSTQTEPSQTQPHTTEPTVTEPVPTEPLPTDPPEPPPSLDPVTKLSCIKWRTYPELLSLGDGLVLASRNYYDGKSAIRNYVDLVNVYSDTVEAQIVNDSPKELIKQRFPDGKFVLADSKTNTFYVYDQSLEVTESFTARNVDGYFSRDRKKYFYVENDILYRMDVSTGNRGRLALEWDMRFESLVGAHPEQDLLVARVYLSFHNRNCGIAVIDAQTGKFRLLSDSLSYVWLSGNMFYGVQSSDTVHGNDIYYGDLDEGQIQRIPTEMLGDDNYRYEVLPGSHYLLRRLVPEEGRRGTAIFDLENGTQMADLDNYDFCDAALNTIFLADEQLILGLYADKYDFDPVVFEPKVLDYGDAVTPEVVPQFERVDVSVAEGYLEELSGPALSYALMDVRQKADAIEDAFGVAVMIGQQTAAFCEEGAVLSNPAQIQSALKTLKTALERYPDGFLKQFRNGANEGGLYFCLTGAIDGELEPIGLAQLQGDRYELTLDITSPELAQTIHHEIWHAIEMRVSTDTFDTAKWAACNPAGFAYYGSYDSGYRNLTKWTYTGGNGENSFFVDAYSRINGREDRARIFEYVMSTDADELMQSTALRQKLQIMSRIIRESFNSDGWGNIYWERYA